jgi:hypothetical protein
LISFADIAVKYLAEIGYEPLLCETEEEARNSVDDLMHKKNGHVYLRLVTPRGKRF